MVIKDILKDIGEPHSHGIHRSDCLSIPTVLRNAIKAEAEKGYDAPAVVEYIKTEKKHLPGSETLQYDTVYSMR